MRKMKKLFAILSVTISTQANAQLPAFPGCEGWGCESVGGRGGQVIFVTNLNDSGPGSLREAIETSGPRIVLFKVSGTIVLNSTLLITEPYLTIAGQTAPGDGIALKNNGYITDQLIDIHTHDVVIRHIRSRPGPTLLPGGSRGNSPIRIINPESYNIVLDHLSLSWGEDKALVIFRGAHDITVQWSIISETLYCANHEETINSQGSNGPCNLGGNPHSRLITISTDPLNICQDTICGTPPTNISMHHNLLTNANYRFPNFNTTNSLMDFVNNVVYNPGIYAAKMAMKDPGFPKMNYVGNYVKSGPNTEPNVYPVIFDPPAGNGTYALYYDSNQVSGIILEPDLAVLDSIGYLSTTRFNAPPITETPADIAYDEVLSYAGAFPRDSADERIVNDTENGTGSFVNHPDEVGGWPVLNSAAPPLDTDDDGMPDSWETAHGTDPNVADDSRDLNGDGYTNIEEYLNELSPGFPTSVADEPDEQPDEFVLLQNYPNPFNPATTIRYRLPAAAEVRLAIYNVTGRMVREVVHHRQPAGEHRVVWDGRDDHGRRVASGLYLYVLKVGEFVQSKKMVLLQ